MEMVMLRLRVWDLVTHKPPPEAERDKVWLEKDIWGR